MGEETRTHPHPHKTQTLNGVGVKGLVEHRRRKGLLWVSTAYRKQRITSTSETETERGREGKEGGQVLIQTTALHNIKL